VNDSAVRWLAIDVVLLTTLLWAVDASAASVMLVQPPSPSPAMAEAIVRMRGELISEGFQVEVMDGVKGTESRAWLEQLAEARKADAVIAVLGDETPDSVEVWVVDKVTEKTVVRRIPFKPQSDLAPKSFAIHTLELLRASFLEIDLRLGSRPSEAKSVPPEVARFVDNERPASREGRFGSEIGGAAVIGFGDVGPAILPLLRLGWAIRPSLVAEVSVAGFGSRSGVQNDVGSAHVAEEFAVLGARYRFLFGRRLRPTLSLSAGALHTRAEAQAQADSPYRGREASLWSFLLDGGAGVGVALTAWCPETRRNACEAEKWKVDPYIATGRQRRSEPPPQVLGRPSANLTNKQQMARKLATKDGAAVYARRKVIVEPVFGQTKEARGFRRFLLRGLAKVRHEWSLISLTHNILKPYAATA
jgi:Transposase DDE domain